MRKLTTVLLAFVLLLGVLPAASFAADARTVNVATADELIAAIRDLQAGDTIVLAPGVYDVRRDLGNMSFGGQPGWYLPLWQANVTLRGSGVAQTTITSTVTSANGVWASQDFVSVWANGVTIEDLTIQSKVDTNKAVEVMGKDFTLRNVDVKTNPAGPETTGDYYEFSGSIYFNPVPSVTGATGTVGASLLENVYVESAWLAAPTSAVTTGTILLRGLTLDWEDAGVAPFSGYGMMSANPVIVVERDVEFIVDETMADIRAQAASRLPVGARLTIAGVTTVSPGVFAGLKRNGAYPAQGQLVVESPALSPSGRPRSTWSFPVGTLSPSYSATFFPDVDVRTTDSSPFSIGAAGVRLVLAQPVELPGPATLDLYVGDTLSGKTFVDSFLGEAAGRYRVDEDGFVKLSMRETFPIDLIELREYEVSFNTDGAAVEPSQKVFSGGLVSQPTMAPAKPGYRFAGWYADPNFARAWDFSSDRVRGATTIYARFSKLPTVALGTPRAPSTMSRSRYYTVDGFLKPRHTAGTYPVRIYRYKYVAGKWKSYGYVKARVKNYNTYSKYSARIRLPHAGRWRLRAYAPTDDLHFATWSPKYDYVTVR